MNRLLSLSCGSLKSDQVDVLRSNGIKTGELDRVGFGMIRFHCLVESHGN